MAPWKGLDMTKTPEERRLRARLKKQAQRRRWGGHTKQDGEARKLAAEQERIRQEALAADLEHQAQLAAERERRRWEASPRRAVLEEQRAVLDVLRRGPS